MDSTFRLPPADPPDTSRSGRPWAWWRWWLPLAALPVLAVLHQFNPAEHAFYPRCQFHTLTGLDCPGCGGLRATHALLHGDLAAAWRLNALFVLALPVAALALLGWMPTRLREWWRNWWLAVLLVTSVAFTVVRNL